MSNQLAIRYHKLLFQDALYSLKSWRLWGYMGLQDFHNQFRRSKLGSYWSIINTVFTAMCIGFVYSHLFKQDLSTFFPYLMTGIVIWNFLVASLVQGCHAFVNSEGYIKQFSYPKQIYIFRFFVTSFMNLAIGMGVCLSILILITVNPSWYTSLIWTTIGLCILIVVSIGHITIFSYAGAKYRDLGPALSSLSVMLFYITPIVFNADMLSSKNLGFIYIYNPLYYLLEIVRYPLLNGGPAPPNIYYSALSYGAIVWLVAVLIMLKNDRKVAYWL